MNEQEMKLMNEKILFYLNEKVKAHLDLKDGTYLNGYFIKEVRDKVYFFEEDKLGQVFVFIPDIKVLEQFRSKKEVENEYLP